MQSRIIIPRVGTIPAWSRPARCLRRWLAPLAVVGLGLASVPATGYGQFLILKDGRSVPAKDLRRSDANNLSLTVEVAGRPAQVGYPVISVERLDLPKPAQVTQVEQFLASGKAREALAAIEPVITTYYPLRDIRGGYWAQAMLLKSAALLSLNRLPEASNELTLISQYTLDPSVALTAKARLATILALGGKVKATQAVDLADSIITATDDRAALSEAYLAKGRAYYAQANYQEALLAFLALPVFYDQQPISTAQALLGSARCYLALGDTERGVGALLDVRNDYPALAEANEAKAELAKGGQTMATVADKITNEKAESEKTFLETAQPNK